MWRPGRRSGASSGSTGAISARLASCPCQHSPEWPPHPDSRRPRRAARPAPATPAVVAPPPGGSAEGQRHLLVSERQLAEGDAAFETSQPECARAGGLTPAGAVRQVIWLQTPFGTNPVNREPPNRVFRRRQVFTAE